MKVIAILAHVDHRKTTLFDSLLRHSGKITLSSAGSLRYLDTRSDEQIRGITLKLSTIELNGRIFIDTPGHIDFEHLVGRAALASDTIVLIVDVGEGITPRMYSLCNYVGKNIVVVVNKIDKTENEEDCLECIRIICDKLSAMLDIPIEWDSNRLIIACSMLCMGMNAERFAELAPKAQNSLANAIKLYFKLREKVFLGEVSSLMKKFGIRDKNAKSIFSKIFPLAECVYSSLGCLENDLKFEENNKNAQNMAAINTYSILKTPISSISAGKDVTVLHAVKIHSGVISKSMKLFCETSAQKKEFVVENIFEICGDEIFEVENSLNLRFVYIVGDILSNSYIYDEYNSERADYFEDEIKRKILNVRPFYGSKLRLLEARETEFRKLIKKLSIVESSLKVKIDKFGCYDIICYGVVQFEKLVNDLHDLGFNFEVCPMPLRFVEGATKKALVEFDDNGFSGSIKIEPIETETNDIVLIEETELTNHAKNEIMSLLNYFVQHGPFTHNKISFTKFVITIRDETAQEEIFNLFKQQIEVVYTLSKPTIFPFYYWVCIFLTQEYLGVVYDQFGKFRCIFQAEEFNERLFFEITIFVPEHDYSKLLEQIKLVSKGTAYVEVRECGFLKSEVRFEDYVKPIRIEKGLETKVKLVDDPEKQRTLKK